MNKTTPDLGETYPAGHPSGRTWQPPVSVYQARARVLHEMNHLEANCHRGIDVDYAVRCLDETLDDYRRMVTGR